ncbi:MAG: L-threonylcarbamoyladenylate synthase [Ignavibacteriaceae bacterium]|jgi:L-threonylcarbamoyladenylate synthase
MINNILVNIDEDPVEAVELAAELYLQGEIFIYPTDTIYGVGANPFNKTAVDKINKLKSRTEKKQFILLINNVETLLNYVELKNKLHMDFLNRIWPAPVSVILKLNNKTSRKLNGKTAAFRIPGNLFCQDLLNQIKAPLISTSVNKNNKKPLTNHLKIKDEFESEVKTIFYTKNKLASAASTLIKLTGKNPVLFREGKIKFVDLLQKFS